MHHGLTVDVLVDAREIAALADEWRVLERRAGSVAAFQSASWCLGWIEAGIAAAAPQAFRVVTVREGSRLVLIWPMAVRRRFGARIAHWLAEPLTQYGDVLADASGNLPLWLDAAWATIESWRDIDLLELRRVRSDAAVAPLLKRLGLRAGPIDSAPVLELGSQPAASVACLRSSRTRSGLRRKMKTLERNGAVTFNVLSRADDCSSAVRQALRFKDDWLRRGGLFSSGLDHPAAERFLMNLAASGELLVGQLSVAGRAIAYEIGPRRGGRYSSFLNAYDGTFAAHAPGRLLTWQMIGHCPQLGIDTYDFLAPAFPHKLEWATAATEIVDQLQPLSRRGYVLAGFLIHVQPRLKALYLRLPADFRSNLLALIFPERFTTYSRSERPPGDQPGPALARRRGPAFNPSFNRRK